MATVIIWNVSQLDCKPTEDGYTDVVVTAHWQCTGVDENAYTASVYSTCSFSAPGDVFTPYPDLTLDQVLGWCWTNGVDKDATEAAVQAQIDNQINPPIVTPPLPWAQGASA
jgi:hypothetical protein